MGPGDQGVTVRGHRQGAGVVVGQGRAPRACWACGEALTVRRVSGSANSVGCITPMRWRPDRRRPWRTSPRASRRCGSACALAEAADLPNRARERLAKAERLTVQWLATLTFFFATVTAKVEALALPPPLETAVLEQLVPALYLERAAARSANAETRHRVRATSTRLLDPLRQPSHPLQTLEPGLLAQVEQVAGTRAPTCFNAVAPVLKGATANYRCIITAVTA